MFELKQDEWIEACKEIDALQAEVARLTAENKSIRENKWERGDLWNAYTELREAHEFATAENRRLLEDYKGAMNCCEDVVRLREALEFYLELDWPEMSCPRTGAHDALKCSGCYPKTVAYAALQLSPVPTQSERNRGLCHPGKSCNFDSCPDEPQPKPHPGHP